MTIITVIIPFGAAWSYIILYKRKRPWQFRRIIYGSFIVAILEAMSIARFESNRRGFVIGVTWCLKNCTTYARNGGLHGSAISCQGRSKKYRKWHFLGCCHAEMRSPIDTQFGRDSYVREATQYAKWYINRFWGVSSTKRWNITPLCLFFVCVLYGSNRWTDFDE